LRDLLHVAILVVAAHDRAELRELLDDLLLYISVSSRPQTWETRLDNLNWLFLE
jgi:hypothetical protein